MRIALIGFGTVGRGFASIIHMHATTIRPHFNEPPRVVAVATRSRGSLTHPDGLALDVLLTDFERYPDAPGLQRGLSPEQIVRECTADVVIEASPSNLDSGQPALDLCFAALEAGKHVVLANKGPVVVALAALEDAARRAGKQFLYEATVMAGTPAIRLGRQALAGAGITRIRGIINGSTNYMLTLMEQGRTYDDAQAEASELGYLEADPSADVDGWDAAGKAIILSAAIFGRKLTFDDMQVSGIRALTPELIEQARIEGDTYRLIADITPESASVSAARIPLTHPLAGITGATNAITYTTELMGDITLSGAGAGGIETGFGLLSDVIEIARREGS